VKTVQERMTGMKNRMNSTRDIVELHELNN